MKPAPHYLPPRSTVVFDHTRRMLDSTHQCMRKFAMSVAERYMQQLAPDQRQVPFRWGVTIDDLCKAEKHNAQVLGRYMDRTVKVLPADLEDAWVASLPEPFRSDCERDLARRRGFVPVRLGAETEAEQTVGVGHLAVEFGQLLEALAPALADGLITESDLPHARRILNESDDLIATVLQVRRRVQSLLPEATS